MPESNYARRRFTEKVTVQLSPAQLEVLRNKADERGLTQSEMLRVLIDSLGEETPKAFLLNGAH